MRQKSGNGSEYSEANGIIAELEVDFDNIRNS
jgi:hypothetical protein